jgi:hypothetical protein
MKPNIRAPVVLAALALGAIVAPATIMPAHAQERTDAREEWNNFLGVIGFGHERQPIDYSPRAMLVVPPTGDLPPPANGAPPLPAGFPQDPDIAARRQALVDARRPIPPGESGASKARAYLIEPPAAYLDAAAVAATGHQADNGEPVAPKRQHRHKGEDSASN